MASFSEVYAYETQNSRSSSAIRLELWKKSLGIIGAAPVIGHGTGSIPEQFARGPQGGVFGLLADNPHNQVFAVAIQLGLIGTAILFAMWVAHLALFRGGGLVAWIGIVIVVQNLASAPFNSHLFNSFHGWLYVFAVGVVGGTALRERGEGRMIALPAKPRILVVALRRLGDVLLTTPLIRSLKRAWPEAAIDVLVFRGTEGILDGQSGYCRCRRDAGARERGRRPRIAAAAMADLRSRDLDARAATGRRCSPGARGGAAPASSMPKAWRRGSSGSRSIIRSRSRAVYIACRTCCASRRRSAFRRYPRSWRQCSPMRPGIAPDRPYAVIHAAPMFRYKRWTAEGWQVLAAGLDARGLTVLATAGPDDRRYLDQVWRASPKCGASSRSHGASLPA